ncbi:hypothetical protein ABNF97_01720 [Plantactinospora sp. B6F1]|uniref:hypothetical protein n=1 Tax=Plantactinospora sp. B6F1 TaxID=3158971 RepID=UPI0032D91C5B
MIRGSGESVAGTDADGEPDRLRDVRHMLDRLYADEDSPDSVRMELISQILLAGVEQARRRTG